VDPRALADHLRFYQELGVTGISRDPAWRKRESFRLKAEATRGGDQEATTETGAAATPTGDRAAEGPAADGLPVEVEWLPPSGGRTEPPSAGRESPESIPVHVFRSPEALAAIRHELGDCTRCKLHGLGRKQIVFGVGNPAADIMFVGEAPGADEDTQGIPFVGKAGQLLTKMIAGMGLQRDEVYIANVLKCRPPGNRDPQPDEVESCEPFLFQQIASIQPKVIIALGAFAARTLLKTQDPISRMRGRVYDYRGAKLIPTFHPSFLLRSPGYKREAWEDLKKALGLLGRQPPGVQN
jgi:uracil-DNA glycosylase family 4